MILLFSRKELDFLQKQQIHPNSLEHSPRLHILYVCDNFRVNKYFQDSFRENQPKGHVITQMLAKTQKRKSSF
jgi:hypothetical protein